MSDKTGIEWTEATWNPVTGCAKVSQGCKHCYAERDWARMQHVPAYAGRKFTDVACHEDRLNIPLRWKKPRLIFVNSMSDLFHESVPNEFIDKVFAVMALAEHHTFQVLTKRPKRMRDYIRCGNGSCIRIGIRHAIEEMGFEDIGAVNKELPNVWLGVSVEDQSTADERIPLLLQTPASVRWISAEPLLGPIDLYPALLPCPNSENSMMDPETGAYECCGKCDYTGVSSDMGIDWVVVGGESGPNARPMHPDWARSLRDQCSAADVPFLFKQWGEWAPRSSCYHTLSDGISFADLDPGATKWPCIRLNENGSDGRMLENEDGGDSAYMQRVGKKLAGRLLEGIEHNGYPEGKVKP
ncbi:DUF5131 family protein [Methylomonas koyamae]|uniref:DUF5131 family protein n=1 Tax=Methylomonas koyamae TaxID=702114 RepID=UPI00112BC024|nr:phage Gp37/Gp68 family protein [Methylomonas koyamae]TPQ24905.1 phage Gp37/Gp68 family protein [Methylomonas koyamae]